MKSGTLRTILLMLASGIVGGVIAVAGLFFLFLHWSTEGSMRGASISFGGKAAQRVASAPKLEGNEDFLGTMASHSDRFTAKDEKILEGGPGRIVGLVTANGAPLKGLKLRLLLNGEVKSEWAESGDDGRYSVPVPYGRYRVDGYELDSAAARRVLAGKTDAPYRGFQMEASPVAEDRPGVGFDLVYVEPVRITGPEGIVPAASPVVLTWASYPGADAYRLQLTEFAQRGDWNAHRQVFEWKARPVVRGTSVDLASIGAQLRRAHHYSVQVEALDANGRAFASNGMRIGKVNFTLAE